MTILCQRYLLWWEDYLLINHFQGANDPVLMNKTPYDRRPDVIGLEFPMAHMQGMSTACSSYVKNMERIRRKDGTTQASAIPRRNRITKSPAKLWQAAWRYRKPDLESLVIWCGLGLTDAYQIVRFSASHFPTGKRWRAQFWGHSARR